MAETDHHRELMFDLIKSLQAYYAQDEMVYVSGNLLLFYEPGNKRRHVSPDVFVVKGVPKKERINYLVWEEGKGPDVVIELTSSSTRAEDVKTKRQLYQDTLRVAEYFLFDPYEDYLEPSMQGYRLRRGQYQPIKAVRGRLPSQVLGLELERHGEELRLWQPQTGHWLPTPAEQVAQAEQARQQGEVALQQMELTLRQAEVARQQAELAQLRAELDKERLLLERDALRRELEELRQRQVGQP